MIFLSESELLDWQDVLEVPVSELLNDLDGPLSRPVMERAKLVRIMKSAAAIQQQASSPGIRRMATTLVNQLIEIMPELEEVSAWHTAGTRRSPDELGRIAERQVSLDYLSD